MPTYDYACQACGHTLEIFHSMKDAPKRKCPKCGRNKLARQIGRGAGFLFKGSGFYATDYRSDSYKQSASSEDKPATQSKLPAESAPAAEHAPKSGCKPDPKRSSSGESLPRQGSVPKGKRPAGD